VDDVAQIWSEISAEVAQFSNTINSPRKVCVRVVDVFGFEAEVVTIMEAV